MIKSVLYPHKTSGRYQIRIKSETRYCHSLKHSSSRKKERNKHASTNCKECLLPEEYAALKHNLRYIQANRLPPQTKTIIFTKCIAHCGQNKQISERQKQQIIRNVLKETKNTTFSKVQKA